MDIEVEKRFVKRVEEKFPAYIKVNSEVYELVTYGLMVGSFRISYYPVIETPPEDPTSYLKDIIEDLEDDAINRMEDFLDSIDYEEIDIETIKNEDERVDEVKGIYKHFKGGTVQVLSIAHHSETLEELVVYKALYDCRTFGKGSIWVRPKSMFIENVMVEGKEVARFKLIG